MKFKFLKAILGMIVIVVPFLMSSNDLKAQCPNGYILVTGFAVSSYGCDYLVDFCYKCDPLGMAGHIQINGFRLQNPKCPRNPANTTNAQIILDIERKLCDNFDLAIACRQDIPPCKIGKLIIKVETPICWKIAKDNNGNCLIAKCDPSNLCLKELRRCRDEITGQIIDEWITFGPDGFYNCPDMMPEYGTPEWDLLILSIPPGGQSSCMYVPQLCN